jgi:hypothetical protein
MVLRGSASHAAGRHPEGRRKKALSMTGPKTLDVAELRRLLKEADPLPVRQLPNRPLDLILTRDNRQMAEVTPNWGVAICGLLNALPALLDRWEAAERVAKKLESMVEFGDLIEEFDDMLEIAALLRGKENEA